MINTWEWGQFWLTYMSGYVKVSVMEPLCKSKTVYTKRERETRTHTHTSISAYLYFIKPNKRQSCPFAGHEDVKQQSWSINFCAFPSDTSVCSMNILCGIQVLNGQCYVQFQPTIPVQQTNLKLWLICLPKPVPPHVLCSQHSSSWMSDHLWTLYTIFWYAALSLCRHHILYHMVVNSAAETFFAHKNWITLQTSLQDQASNSVAYCTSTYLWTASDWLTDFDWRTDQPNDWLTPAPSVARYPH